MCCYENQLTSLDVSNDTALKELYCDENSLTNLDLSTNTALTYVLCDEGVEVTGYSRVVHHPGE